MEKLEVKTIRVPYPVYFTVKKFHNSFSEWARKKLRNSLIERLPDKLNHKDGKSLLESIVDVIGDKRKTGFMKHLLHYKNYQTSIRLTEEMVTSYNELSEKFRISFSETVRMILLYYFVHEFEPNQIYKDVPWYFLR